MSTTIHAEAQDMGTFWDDQATVLRKEAAASVFHDFASLHSGPFAEMIRLVLRMPDDERASLVIEKAGDRQYCGQEIVALARRSDFPR
jgi:hypothetical protein